MVGEEVGEVELAMGQEQVDFDHNNHLILDCSHQCNHNFHYNYNHHIHNPVNYTRMIK